MSCEADLYLCCSHYMAMAKDPLSHGLAQVKFKMHTYRYVKIN